MKKNKKIVLSIIILLIIIITVLVSLIFKNNNKGKLVSVKSQKELMKIYEGEEVGLTEYILKIVSMPFSVWMDEFSIHEKKYIADYSLPTNFDIDSVDLYNATTTSSNKENSANAKDYSTTNIQVENVDEADIIKTDGDFIYSISDDNIIITDVRDSENIKIVKKIRITEGYPEDLMLYNNTLTVIAGTIGYNNKNTIVYIYDIQNRQSPVLKKSYTLYEPYYTSRCIGNKLYVLSSGSLRKENNEIITYYTEDRNKQEINLRDIKYLNNSPDNIQTIISVVDLNNLTQKIDVKSYLLNMENAYISENNIYLLNNDYKDIYEESISDVFGWKGVFGLLEIKNNISYKTEIHTNIYKFHIQEDGNIKYENSAEVEGTTINQFSIDEFEDNLRLAVTTNYGSKVIVLDNKLNKIGETPYLAKGENIYSSRFMGNKAYLVTYQTMDPLFVIDLSNPKNPIVLGELKIPGYSTYLHPYDENHIIGIGMQTEEIINKNSLGKVISKTAKITGMKMALFDISDVNNPVQISDTIIGDSRATSSILTNHKAILFSKEKELIAIPVNNYSADFAITNNSDNYETIINNYKNYSENYISEGYFVYKINLDDGFSLKGIINHENNESKTVKSYYPLNTKMLRGLYINNDLYTISEDMIKVNSLDNLELISELKIKGGQ